MNEKNKTILPSKDQVKKIFPNISDKDLEVLLHVAQKTGLDVIQRQIYAVPRGGGSTIQTSIDGFRLIAERTGNYAPGHESIFEYDENGKLKKATSYVKKRTDDGTWHEIAVSAFMDEFNAQSTFWKRMPHVMLSKVAEAAALRRAFPDALSGIYSDDEMDQASPVEAVKALPLTEDEIERLDALIDASETDVVKFLDHYQIDDIKSMPREKYDGAIKMMEKKLSKKGVTNGTEI